jgi:hypothetical protein
MKICTFAIETCYDCPMCKFYLDSGCRNYTPSHYTCYAMMDNKERGKVIVTERWNRMLSPEMASLPALTEEEAKRQPDWDGKIPDWCPLHTVDAVPKDSMKWDRFI